MAVKDQCLLFSAREKQSQEAFLAPMTRIEEPSDIIVKESVEHEGGYREHDANSRIGCSAFTMFPNNQSKSNKRALGQANRYMNANARKQSKHDTAGTRGVNSGKLSADSPLCDSKSTIAEPVDEDGKMAKSTALALMDISKGAVPSLPCEHPTEIYLPEFEEMELEQLRLINPIGPVRKATSTFEYHCVQPHCEYFSKSFTSKARRNCHVLSHYNRVIICDFCSVNIPQGFRTFASVAALKDHIMFRHICEQDCGARSDCTTCQRDSLNPEGFYYHIESCMLQWMEEKALEDLSKCSIH